MDFCISTHVVHLKQGVLFKFEWTEQADHIQTFKHESMRYHVSESWF